MAAVCLKAFLAEAAKQPFDWTRCNCLTFCADWVRLRTGRDPAAQWRTVKSKKQARKVTREAGGDIALCERAMRTFGASEIECPRAGDVALVRAPVTRRGNTVRYRAIGAICVAPHRFAVLTPDLGLVIAPLPVIRAWAIDG